MPPKRKYSALASFGPLARGYKKARQVVRRRKAYIKGAIRPVKEYNFVNTLSTVVPGTVNTFVGASTAILLNGIAEGDDNTERNGRKVNIVSVDCKILHNGAAVSQPTTVRTVLIWDNNSQGVAPLTGDIFTNLSSNWLNAPFNVDNENRFTILYDRRIMLSQGIFFILNNYKINIYTSQMF